MLGVGSERVEAGRLVPGVAPAPPAAASARRRTYLVHWLFGVGVLAMLLATSTASAAGSRRAQRRLLGHNSVTAPDLGANAQSGANHLAGARPAVTHEHPDPSGLTPQQLHAAYELPSETASSSSQTVALVELGGDPTAEADLGVFDSQFALPPCTSASGCFRVINEEGNPSPLPTDNYRAGETSLDVDMVRAICQTCHIIVVEGSPEGNGILELSRAINSAADAGATEVSTSIEWYAADSEAEEATFLDEVNETYFAHPGVVLTASSGDCGFDDENEGGEDFEFCKGRPWHYPGFPAKMPDVVAVGGTNLTEHGGVWKSTAWSNAGSGCTSISAAPLWQTSLPNWSATGCGGERSISDVSADASCKTGPDAYDTTLAPDWDAGAATGWAVVCGTSVASPIVAAEFALAGGARGVEDPASTLYAHAGESSAFYDVVEGSSGSCAGRTTCDAAVGYDGPTGLGSPIGLAAFSLAGSPLNTSPPTISGIAAQGQTLTAAAGAWENSPTSSGVQWEDCNAGGAGCLPIGGATSSTYNPTGKDTGKTIRVQETVGNASGYGPPAVSAHTARVPSAAPTVQTGVASAVTKTSATLNATVDPNGLSVTDCVLEYGTTEAYGSSVGCNPAPGSEESAVAVSGVASVAEGTTYHFRIVATNEGGTSYGDDQTFTAPGAAPTVTQIAPTSGPTTGGTSVTVTGTNFTGVESVKFGSSAGVIQSVTPTSITVEAPAGTKKVYVTVTTPGGTSAASGKAAKKARFKYKKVR
jgi:hypothetical protein